MEGIPNKFHFIYGLIGKEEISFPHYLSVYSAILVNKPIEVNFYYRHEPYGRWWDLIKEMPIKFHQVETPEYIGKKKIKKRPHKADALRMDILCRDGGIYHDIDTICVKPYGDLLNNNVVLGEENPSKICNAIMLTKPRSSFFTEWWNKYESHFNPDGWSEASLTLPMQLHKAGGHDIKVLPSDYFFKPGCTQVNKIFIEDFDIPDNLVTLHWWNTFANKLGNLPDDWSWAERYPHTLFGRIMNKISSHSLWTGHEL
jgi:hypothetical protein